ncbi:hypothetical protein PAMP_018600 [Pampus punctatissimus]
MWQPASERLQAGGGGEEEIDGGGGRSYAAFYSVLRIRSVLVLPLSLCFLSLCPFLLYVLYLPIPPLADHIPQSVLGGPSSQAQAMLVQRRIAQYAVIPRFPRSVGGIIEQKGVVSRGLQRN